MSIQSRQALRLLKFVAELKKNSYPNTTSFSKLLKKIDLEENIPCACTPRTILRDIQVLIDDYHAPIAYSAACRGYYLTRPWDFEIPLLGDDILSMTMLGTKLAGDILPAPLKNDVEQAMAKTLTGNTPEFFDEAMINSILCASGIKASVSPEIFKKIFDAWRSHRVMKLRYTKPNDEPSSYEFEPHIIAFHKGVWYVKGRERSSQEIKNFAIQRISSVEFTPASFETDKKLLENTRRNGLFEYPKLNGVMLHCDAEIAFYFYEHQKAKKFKIDRQEDGSIIVTLKPAFEHEVIRYVLGEAGKIRVLHPEGLRLKIAELGKKIWEKNS